MSSLNSALRQETAFVYSAQPQQTLTPAWASLTPGSASGLYNFTLQSVGGAVFLQDSVPKAHSERGVHWQIENSTTGALHLTEFTVHGGASGPRTTVETGYQLFPALAATGTTDGRLLLAALLSNGFLLHTELRCSETTDGVLAGLTASRLRPLDLTQHLAPLGTPTSLAATSEAVLVGGSNGSIVCIPIASLEDGNPSRCFELRDSSWALTKLIPGVLFRPRQPAALACVHITLSSRQLLLVSYDDCNLRVFNVARRHQLATLELDVPGPTNTIGGGAASGARHMVPTYFAAECAMATAASTTTATLVVQFEATDTLERYTYAYTLSASSSGRLSLSSPTALAVEPGDVVSEARVSGDTVWLLLKAQGRAKVVGFLRSSGEVVSNAVLSESAGEHSSAAAVNGAEVDQELWEWLLQTFPGELSAEEQVCQQVLVPGQTCRASLRDALSYHGAQLTTADVDTAPYGVLRSWMRAAVMAIQRGTPTASLSECWQSFLATYRAAWARRHPPLGLVLHRGSPEWLGLARGGAVLCVLRRGTGVEALQTSLELPAHLDAVHCCAAEAGALLGPLVQEACLALLVAGVDPLERLIPRLCKLWLEGPATATAGESGLGPGAVGGSGRVAALTDSAREALQRWRQRRQQLLIAMGSRLGGLDNAASAVRAYLGLLRLLGSQANQELSSAHVANAAGAATATALQAAAGLGAAPPSKAATAFLVSTCRQVSRAAAATARDAALLLGLILQQGAWGTCPLDEATRLRLHEGLLPEACGLLRRAALGLWLTGMPSSQDEATDMEPALAALRHLRLGSPPEGPERASATTAALPQQRPHSSALASGDVSLAAKLLPAFCAAYAGGRGGRLDLLMGAESTGLLFTLYLQYGEQPNASIAARVLQLGYQLFQAGEYGNLAELASLAGATGSSEAGPQFLRGLGVTCALALERQQQQQRGLVMRRAAGAVAGAGGGGAGAQGGSAACRPKRIAEAADCFFRASASLATETGGTLRSVLQNLRSELVGSINLAGREGGATAVAATTTAGGVAGSAAGPQQQRREVALLQLHFCEAVMQLFEREGAPEGAVMFAAAALEHLRAAYSSASDSAGGGDGGAGIGALPGIAAAIDSAAPLLPGEDALLRAAAESAAEERAEREGRLWSNIYSYCVDLRQYDSAYAALLSNPRPAARLQSLRHLVHVLAQERQLQTLCTLPLANVAILPAAPGHAGGAPPSAAAVGAAPRAVSLLSEALDLLHRRAHNCDLAESPQPYQVLYDFLVARSEFKGAARAMAAYAWRLRVEAPSSEAAVAEALRAYDLAINCLSLLDPEDAWLDLTDPWIQKIAPYVNHAHACTADTPSKKTATSGVSGGAADSALVRVGSASGDGGAPAAGAATAAAAGRGVGARGGAAGGGGVPVATVQTLQRERTMLHYCALVATRVAGLEPMRQWDNEDAILRQLLLMGRYEGAQVLVADCYGTRGSDPWVRAMETVVGELAAHCTRLQLQDGGVPTGGPPLPPTDLFADDPDGAAAAISVTGAAAVAATLGGRAAPLWSQLRELLLAVQHSAAIGDLAAAELPRGGTGGGVRVGWLLRDAAAEAVLRTDPRVDLPQWLLDMFLFGPFGGSDSASAAMGSSACGPASLLSLYLRHDRLAAAVELVAAQVQRWSHVDVRQRRLLGAAWMPYPQLELLQTKLAIAQQLGQERSSALLQQLNDAVAAHLDLVATETERLKEQQQQHYYTLTAGGGASGGPLLLTAAAGADRQAGPAGEGEGAMGMAAAMPPPLRLLGAVSAAPTATSSPMTPEMVNISPQFGMGLSAGLRLFG